MFIRNNLFESLNLLSVSHFTLSYCMVPPKIFLTGVWDSFLFTEGFISNIRKLMTM